MAEASEKAKGDLAALQALAVRAQQGDGSALEPLRAALDQHPRLCECWGDMARQAEATLVEVYTGQDHLFRETLTRRLKALRKELAGPDCPPLERLLVERIAVCWLQVYYLDAMFARSTDQTLAWYDFQQRRQDRAHRRFLSAARTLAAVRRLRLPPMQVNIAEKQINVAQ